MQKRTVLLIAIFMELVSMTALQAREPEKRRGRGRGEGEVRVASGRDRAPRQNKVEGVVLAVNVSTGQVSIRQRNGVTVVVVATAATKVERNDLHATLGAIQVGDRGQALYGNDFIASKIESTGP